MNKYFALMFLGLLCSLNLVAQHRSMEFDGVDDFFEMPSLPNFDLDNALTVEFWINPDLWDGNWRGIVSNRDNFGINSRGSVNRFQWYFRPSGGGFQTIQISPAMVPPGTWTHIAATLEQVGPNVASALYVNGTLAASNTFASVSLASAVPTPTTVVGATFGTPFGFYRELFDGKLDEVRIWNFAKSQQEVLDEMNTVVPPNSTGLVAYYSFNQADGPVIDVSGNGNTGTRIGIAGPQNLPQYSPVNAPISQFFIPTLSQWGLIFFVLLLSTMGLSAVWYRKRKMTFA